MVAPSGRVIICSAILVPGLSSTIAYLLLFRIYAIVLLERDGPIIANIKSSFLKPTAFSAVK